MSIVTTVPMYRRLNQKKKVELLYYILPCSLKTLQFSILKSSTLELRYWLASFQSYVRSFVDQKHRYHLRLMSRNLGTSA